PEPSRISMACSAADAAGAAAANAAVNRTRYSILAGALAGKEMPLRKPETNPDMPSCIVEVAHLRQNATGHLLRWAWRAAATGGKSKSCSMPRGRFLQRSGGRGWRGNLHG